MMQSLNEAANTWEWASYAEGPRSARIEILLRNIAWLCRLEISIEKDKSWFRETVRFHVKGKEASVRNFQEMFVQSVHEFNEGEGSDVPHEP